MGKRKAATVEPKPVDEIPFDAEIVDVKPAPKPVQRCRSFHPAMSELRCILPDGHEGEHSGNGQGWADEKEVIREAINAAIINGPAGFTGEQIESMTVPLLGNGPIGASTPPTTPATRKPKKPEQVAADERRIKQVMEFLTNNGEIVRFSGYLFYAWIFKAADYAGDVVPHIGMRVWTEHDLVVWFNAASKYMGRQGCTMQSALATTMPESRKYEPVTVTAPADQKQDGTLWEAGT